MSGYEDSYEHCQENFKYEPWNCPKPAQVKNAKHPISFTDIYKDGKHVTLIYCYLLIFECSLRIVVISVLLNLRSCFTCETHTKVTSCHYWLFWRVFYVKANASILNSLHFSRPNKICGFNVINNLIVLWQIPLTFLPLI